MYTDIFNRISGNLKDPFNLGSSRRIKQNVNSLIERYPNWMIYVRRNVKFKCPDCYDDPSKNPDSFCQVCFGLGYKVSFEKHMVRRVIKAADAQSPLEPFGYLAKYRTIIYTPKSYYPKSKDIYIEVEWDKSVDQIKTYGRPVSVIDIYQVDEAIAFKESEVSYFGAGCDTFNFSNNYIKKWLLELQPGSYQVPNIT